MPPALSDTQISRLEVALRRHWVWLRKALEDTERDVADLHLPIAGHLRSLLCDAKVPILLVYAEHKGIELQVWGPNPPGFSPDPRKLAMQIHALAASPTSVADSYQLTIRAYLDTPIGGMPVPEAGGGRPTRTIWYTPKQLIKWAAQKEGVAHLDLDEHPSFSAIEGGFVGVGQASLEGPEGTVLVFGADDNFLVRSALLQLALWAVHSIELVLSDPVGRP